MDVALRADIRLLTTLLGETLVRSEGPGRLGLVEMVRGQAKAGGLTDLPSEVDERLQQMDLPTTIKGTTSAGSYRTRLDGSLLVAPRHDQRHLRRTYDGATWTPILLGGSNGRLHEGAVVLGLHWIRS